MHLKEVTLKLESVKMKLLELVNIINAMSPISKVKFHQQDAIKGNMAIMGGENGTLWISPCSSGFDIGLSGKSLEAEMSGFMCEICKSECTGYKQKNGKVGKMDLPFWRVDDFSLVQKAAYYYAGTSLLFNNENIFPEEVSEPEEYIEGALKTISVNIYERNQKARSECIKYHGYACKVCSFDFEKHYGSLGKEFIHVHHVVPLSNIQSEYKLNPKTDLIPVCPNCHAMLHRLKGILSVGQLKQLISAAPMHNQDRELLK